MNVVRKFIEEGTNKKGLTFYCEGCEMSHSIIYEGTSGPIWKWNNSLDKPTIKPSIKAQWVKTNPKTHLKVRDMICHSYVKEGMLEYLTDCTHKLAGKTVPMSPE